jgi:plasmid stabilization system protein ParE
VRTVRLAPGAIADIRRILHRSKVEFGPGAGTRYKALLDQALQDLREDPCRLGVRPVPDIRPGYFVYHVKFSKPRVTGRTVGRPRHLVIFSVDSSEAVLVAAVVHEREMLERHLEV